MRTIGLFLYFLLELFRASAQKPPLSLSDLGNWTSVANPKISADGKYVLYSIQHIFHDAPESADLIAQATDNSWKIEIPSVRQYFFSTDGKKIFFLKRGDSLGLLTAGSSIIQYISKTDFLKMPGDPFNTAYSTGDDCVFNNEHKRKYFLSLNQDHRKSLWLYDRSRKNNRLLINGDTLYNNTGFVLKSIRPDNYKNNHLFLIAENKHVIQQPAYEDRDMIIWSYRDKMLPSQSRGNINSIVLVFNIDKKEIIFSETANEHILDNSATHLLVQHDSSDYDYQEWYWNPASLKKFFVVSLITGQRRFLFESRENYPACMSSDKKFIIFYDAKLNKSFSYEVKTSVVRTLLIPDAVSSLYDSSKHHGMYAGSFSPLGWVSDVSGVLFKDHYDIWQIDLYGKKNAINITNGYGQNHRIAFQPALKSYRMNFRAGESVILSAFNKDTKNNGFFEITMGANRDPVKRMMAPYNYEILDAFPGVPVSSEPPIKATDSFCYIVKRMDASTSPNYFFTRDFEKFTQLSFIYPEKKFNWLTTELVNWKCFDGTPSKGILYKPEDFDPQKKYPVIFYYYEELSDQLNTYFPPAPCYGPINIPWFVSNGYLVFVPDIHYTPGHPGESAYNAVVSAAQYLSEKNYVNKDRMGLQGHSFAGYETNYIVTHSNLFAAACSAAGMCDITTDFQTLWGNGASKIAHAEGNQVYMRSLPWTQRQLYLQNSPVYFINDLTTPLLLMHNRKDYSVDFSQGLEFFLSLRRAGKKVWLLEYKNGGHILDYTSGMDFTTRLTQFFDHYLKDQPAPDWMK